MKASNMNAVKFIVIVLVALALRMAAVVVCGGDPVAGVHQYREIVAACKVFPFALGMLAMAYGALLAVYLTFRRYWAGRPAQQGLVFGSLFGLIWVVGMIEGSLVLATFLKHEIIFGLCEVPPILSVGLLGGLLFRSANEDTPTPVASGLMDGLYTSIAIVLSFLAGRYLSYSVINVESAFLKLPAETFLWTLAMGMTVGVLYQFCGRTLPGSPLVKGLLFSFVVFGIDWMLFTQVVPVLFYVTPFEWFRSFVVRVLMDCVFIAMGVAISSGTQREYCRQESRCHEGLSEEMNS